MDWTKLTALDVRWIWLILLIVITIPLFKPLGLPIKVSPEVIDYVETIDALPKGSVIWIGADYDPGSSAENNPQLAATFKHAMKRDLKVVILSLWPGAPDLVQSVIDPIAESMGKIYGVDYVNLGYKPAGGVVLRTMTRDIRQGAGNVDHAGTPLDKLPLMQEITALTKEQVALVISINTGSPGYGDYLNYVAEPLGIPFLSAPTMGMVTGQLPFYRSGQIKGLLPGLSGAAQYEQWLGEPGLACTQMDAQSLGHVIILAFIALGNIGYLASRSKGGL